MTALSEAEKLHYSRQTILPGWGEEGQLRLKDACVLVIGAGGLGAPALMYLAGAGVGHIGVADGDFVEASNLHRQVIHSTASLNSPKASSAAKRIRELNPHIEVLEHAFPITQKNARSVIGRYDVVCDCTDNFSTRDLIAQICFEERVPLVSGAAQLTDGAVTTFKPYLGAGHPCFRCLYPAPLGPELTPSCALIGVAGPTLAVIGGLQAMETIKEIIGFGESLSGRVLTYDGLQASTNVLVLPKRDACDCWRAAGGDRSPNDMTDLTPP